MSRRKQHRINIVVYDNNDREIRNFNTDMKGQGAKNWMFELVYWATMNGHTVEFITSENLKRENNDRLSISDNNS